jgi:tRNA threonylcarbamoyladenosine biosynthesis protein TsaB
MTLLLSKHSSLRKQRSQNLKLLAVDTSTEACSAALLIDGEVSQQYQLAPREHSHLILGMIDGLLSDAEITSKDLDAMAFGRGPGSFMGIRVAAGVVQGIAFAQSIPVVPVSTLAAISLVAMQQANTDRVLAAIDARMKEVYWGAYVRQTDGSIVLQGEECVVSPELAPVPESGEWVAAGTGWSTYGDVMKPMLGERLLDSLDDCFPTADAIARLGALAYESGGAVAAAEAVPVYLRDNVASKPQQGAKSR